MRFGFLCMYIMGSYVHFLILVILRFGRYDHEDWCVHKSSLCTWNINKSIVTGNKPDSVIDTSCCLMSVEFHPVEPALIAGGTFNGKRF